MQISKEDFDDMCMYSFKYCLETDIKPNFIKNIIETRVRCQYLKDGEMEILEIVRNDNSTR